MLSSEPKKNKGADQIARLTGLCHYFSHVTKLGFLVWRPNLSAIVFC